MAAKFTYIVFREKVSPSLSALSGITMTEAISVVFENYREAKEYFINCINEMMEKTSPLHAISFAGFPKGTGGWLKEVYASRCWNETRTHVSYSR